MLMLLRVLIASILVLATPSDLRAGETSANSGTSKRLPMKFGSLSTTDFMTPKELAAYTKALLEFNCEKAGSILETSFVRAVPRPNKNDQTSQEALSISSVDWHGKAGLHFTDYGYCVSFTGFAEIEQELGKSKDADTKYDDHWFDAPKTGLAGVKRRRDARISGFLGQAQGDYPPAIVMLADLVRRGDVFTVDKEVEYYLLNRACHLQHDCKVISARMSTLAQGLGDERRQYIEKAARSSKSLVSDAFDEGRVP